MNLKHSRYLKLPDKMMNTGKNISAYNIKSGTGRKERRNYTMPKIKHLQFAHIYLDLARAAATMAKVHAMTNPYKSMELDSQYVDYITMARNHLIKCRKGA